MIRRRRAKPSGGVQMFSFLDAMICTMGALLVLLHAFARHGQVEIAHKIEARSTRESQADLKAERESLQWRSEQLKEARAKTEAQLAEERLKLSHLEDHERRLRDKLEPLKIAVVEMERLGTAQKRERQQTLAELEAAQDRVRKEQQEVEDARHQARSTSYSVVPYEGPNTTRRRPIYIECRANSIVLQPEGIELAPDDFSGLLGPGNPLASALRAIREYLAQQSPDAKQAKEPYPLLLVRPAGIEAYYAARAALDTWGSEFGYELVGSDWTLKFPEPDPRLAELTRQVVAEARVRQQEYIRSSPQLARQRPRTTYHARSHGGFVPEHGGGGRGGAGGSGPGGWEALGSNWARRGGATRANNENGDASGSPGGNDQTPGAGGAFARTDGGDGGSFDAARGDAARPNGAFAPGQNPSGGGGSRFGPAGAGKPLDASSASGSGEQNGDSRNTDSALAGSLGNQNRGRAQANASGTTGAQDNQASSDAASSSASQAPAGSSATASSRSASSSGSPGGSGSSQSVSVGTPPSAFAPTSPSKKTNSLAKSRGRDWGLPESGVGAVAATRPILIECHNDHLVLLPESSHELPKQVRLGPKTQDSMDELVSDVWQHMKGWGTAGKGLYWRPTLAMQVEPGAADRYAEIKALMADSGLDVRERQPRATAKGPAKKTSRQ